MSGVILGVILGVIVWGVLLGWLLTGWLSLVFALALTGAVFYLLTRGARDE